MYQGLAFELAEIMPAALDTGMFTSLCSIQQPSGTLTASGAPDGNWVDVAGLTNIVCCHMPPGSSRIQATEVKALSEIMAVNIRHVLLSGYFPTILTSWRAVVDGIDYDILGTEWDSQKQMTRLQVRIATV